MVLALAACADMAKRQEPQRTLLPTVNIAPAKGWPVGVVLDKRGALPVP